MNVKDIVVAFKEIERVMDSDYISKGSTYEIGKCEPFGRLHYCNLTVWVESYYKTVAARDESVCKAIFSAVDELDKFKQEENL